MAYELRNCPYAPKCLEPHIDAKTMEIHHGKHHQPTSPTPTISSRTKPRSRPSTSTRSSPTSRKCRGDSRRGAQQRRRSLEPLLFLDDQWRRTIRNAPTGALAPRSRRKLGGFAKFKEDFAKAGANAFRSGWAWLYVGADKKLAVGSTANQDSPLMGKARSPAIEGKPIIGCDVWEHAYYLNYQNRRPDYITAWWNIVNWKPPRRITPPR